MNTWTVELPAGMPLLNANRRQHWAAKAKLTRALREAALVCARRDHVPALDRAHIVVEYRPPDRRRRDVHNLAPSAKACVDGVVDAGVLPDDADEYLIGPDLRVGPVVPGGQLILHIAELEGGVMGHTPDAYSALLGALLLDPWGDQAACIGKADILESPNETPAKTMCAYCPVIQQCTTWVLGLNHKQDPGGVRAGMNETQRNRSRRQLEALKAQAKEVAA